MNELTLAIKFQDIVERREIRDYADLARLGYVTRARITQIMNLLLLAPDIQECLLGRTALSPSSRELPERCLRSIAKLVSWRDQRAAWGNVKNA